MTRQVTYDPWNEVVLMQLDWAGPEACAECGALVEFLPGDWRYGAYWYHLAEPDVLCNRCVSAHAS